MSCKTVCSALFLLITVLNCSKTDDVIPTCKEGFRNCCFGYIWNYSSNACENCKPGYTGLNCSLKCPYPTYGILCQGFCECDLNQCDASRGCKNLSSGMVRDNDTAEQPPTRVFGEKRDKTFIFITTLGCIGLLLLTAHLIVYIIDRRRRSISETTTCESVMKQGSMYQNVNNVSLPVIE